MANKIDGRKVALDLAQRNRSHPKLMFINEDPDGIEITQITEGGDVNYVYRVKSKDGQQSVVLKYGQELCRAMDFLNIPLERQDLEFGAMEAYHSVHVGSVPEPYCFDKDLHTMAMEDLSHMEMLGDALDNKRNWKELAKLMGETMSKVHCRTSSGVVTKSKWNQQVSIFRCGKPVEWYIGFRFIDIFIEDHPQNQIMEGFRETYRECVTSLQSVHIKELLIETFKREECVIHSDLHKHSLFVSQDRVALFDLEFSMLGNSAYDSSYIISNYLMALHDWLPQLTEDEKQEMTKLTRQSCLIFIESYMKGREDLVSEDQKMKFLTNNALFLGSTLFGIPIYCGPTTPKTAEEKNMVVRIATDLMLKHKDFKTWDEIIDSVLSKY